jgi:hypothetical protein
LYAIFAFWQKINIIENLCGTKGLLGGDVGQLTQRADTASGHILVPHVVDFFYQKRD